MYYGRSNRVNAAPHPSKRPKTTMILPFEKKKNAGKNIREGRFELPTKGSLRTQMHTLQSSALPLSYPRCAPCILPIDHQPPQCGRAGKIKKSAKEDAPPLGIEPRTCRLTADRSANGALEAHIAGTRAHYPSEIWAQFPPFGQKIPRPGFEPGSRG